MKVLRALVLASVLVVAPSVGLATSRIDVPAVDAAAKALREDPNLSGEKTERRLVLKDRKREPRKEAETANWLVDFFKWLNEAGRVLMWVLGGVAVIAVLLALKRWLDVRGEGAGRAALNPPTHVRDLDIRPESLPDDIGAAVWARWRESTEWTARRAALSLLYRGAVSRLVHVWRVPIRASSTEGECADLARPRVSAERGAYVAALIEVWQRAVYGLRAPSDETVLSLCQRFGAMLDAPKDAAAAGGAPAAARVAA
jgi:hypothetical protein